MRSLSVRTRFEVLKRDRFTCSYCGKHPPDVLLEVDHIIPRAAGGTDDMANLTTACDQCNAGKSDRLLEEGTAPTVTRSTVDTLRERLEQAAAYTELVGQQAGLVEKQIALVNELWARTFGASLHETADGTIWTFEGYGRFPDESSIRTFIRRLPVNEILAAIEITGGRFSSATAGACKFFYKVCWRRIKGESGPIDGPGALPPSEASRWQAKVDDATEREYDARAELDDAHHRIGLLLDENADLRAQIETLREKRGKGQWTRIRDIINGGE